MTKRATTPAEATAEIARRFGVDRLEPVGSDREDFPKIFVGDVQAMLLAAYSAGQAEIERQLEEADDAPLELALQPADARTPATRAAPPGRRSGSRALVRDALELIKQEAFVEGWEAALAQRDAEDEKEDRP